MYYKDPGSGVYYQKVGGTDQVVSDPATLRGLSSGAIASKPLKIFSGTNVATAQVVPSLQGTSAGQQVQQSNQQSIGQAQQQGVHKTATPSAALPLGYDPHANAKSNLISWLQGNSQPTDDASLAAFAASYGLPSPTTGQEWSNLKGKLETQVSGGQGWPSAQAGQQQGPAQKPQDDMGNILQTYLDELRARGIAINPNVEITPEKLAEFLKKAESEIAPYYATQLAVARDKVLREFGYATEEIQLLERRLEQQYGKGVRTLGESAAERGFAQSGIRQREERELADETQQTIDDRRRQLEQQATGVAAQYAGQYGTANLPAIPSLPSTPRVLAGEGAFQHTGQASPFYSLSSQVYDSLTGSQQFQERADVQSRASDLEEAFRVKEGIGQFRTLIL